MGEDKIMRPRAIERAADQDEWPASEALHQQESQEVISLPPWRVFDLHGLPDAAPPPVRGQIAGPLMIAAEYCPACRSIIYSRRHRLCGVCARPLPEQFLFSHDEAVRIEELIDLERQRHRRWLARVCG